MKRQSKLNPKELAEQALAESQAKGQTVTEFANVESMLRHDALHTPVPPSIARRLHDSVGPVPPPSWWRKLFGG